MKQKYSLIIVCIILGLASCIQKSKDDGIICTSMYAMIGVQVEGAQLTDFYTIRTANGDTLRYAQQGIANWYSIVEDNYQSKLKNKTETFVFHGWVNGVEKIKETYVIGADACHVFKQSGKDTLQL